ncbi:MAG: hypothetical protein ACTS4V_01185 [Candidatus Hodgkinia cicadicola]
MVRAPCGFVAAAFGLTSSQMRQKTETNGKWGRLIQRFDFVGNERPLRGGISEELKWDELLKKLFYCFDSLSYEMFFLRRVEREGEVVYSFEMEAVGVVCRLVALYGGELR